MDKVFIVVKDGMVQEVYSTMSQQEVYVEVLDLDVSGVDEEQEKALHFRHEAIRELMYRID
ncbi:MAG: hypothetical protein Q4C40_01415 [Eubacteriales bacterium]|nr:hypothetical protein [Eubacteriales bacterium]